MAEIKSIHLVGIAGTGMGSFAGLLRARGYLVRGSDENVYPPMSDKLATWGIEVRTPYRPENLDPAPDLVVIGNVIRRTNPEAQAVIAQGLPYTSFPKALGDLFLSERHAVVVAGTHGKTTTTSLIAWLLTSAGRDPSLLVGGVPTNFGEGFRLGAGAHFVVEGDEYDTAYFDKVPKFLHYHPRTLVVTSLEFDHADIYPNVEAIEREFEKVIALVPPDGRIFACASQARVPPRLATARAPVETYSARPGVAATWRAEEIELDARGASFTLTKAGSSVGRLFFSMSGLYNVENAVVASAFALTTGLSLAEVGRGLSSFQGVARRQAVRMELDGVRVIDDFAHHPTAVKETLEGLRIRYPEGQLWAIFEPRSATSSRAYFQREYAEAFDHADRVIIAQVGRPEIAESERLDTVRLAKDISARSRHAESIAKVDDIVARVVEGAQPKDTVVIMSNGGFGGIFGKLEAGLTSRSGHTKQGVS